MSEPKENYQDILREHFFLFSKYLVAEDFLEKLISDEVLSLDDKEVVLNQVVHQNRRQRANKLIEILMTRGERGFQKFLDILEFHNPEVFKIVTKKEPRSPPPEFHRNRSSDYLRMLPVLPQLLEHIKAEVVANSELDSQLNVLQQLLHVSKEENQALENDLEMLRNVRQENMDLKITLKRMELKEHESQVAISDWSQKSYQLLETVNEFKEKCNELQVKYDDLVKQKATTSDNSDVSVKAEKPKEPPKNMVDHAPHLKARLEILQHELDNYKQHCEEINHNLQKSYDANKTLEEEKEKLKKELKTLIREKNTLDTKCMDYSVKHESYFKTIQKKNDEILELQHRRLEDQRRITDLNHEKNELFEKNHSLDEQFQALKAEHDKMKARLSTGSRSSQEYNSQSLDQSNGSSASDFENIEEAPKTVHRKIQAYNDIVLRPQSTILQERRKVIKKNSSAEKCGDRFPALDESLPYSSVNICDSINDGDNDISYKACTLPSFGNVTAEQLFRREVAHFRYSRRNTETSSMRAHRGSSIEKEYGSGLYGNTVGRVSDLSFNNSIKREPVSHPAESVELEDDASETSVYIPRSPRSLGHELSRQDAIHDKVDDNTNKVDETLGKRSDNDTAQTRNREKNKTSGLPSGGKRYRKPDTVTLDIEGEASCDSIIDRSDYSTHDSPVITDFSTHDVHTALLAKDRLVVNRPNWTDRNMGRLIKVKYSLIKDVEFIGGNHTGIFVSKACKPLELNEGEQVCAVSITPQERINPVKMSTTGCTLQDFLQIVKGDLINKKKEREIVLEMKNSRQEYVFACEWMKNNNGHGDYFFVRCNVYVDRRGDDDTSLHPGEIYLVKNTCHDIDHWLTHNVDPISGKMSMATTLIPNKQQAQVRRLSRGRSLDEEDKIKRGGFKVKGSVYDRVVPLKAIIKLPIFVVGPDTSLITAFLNLIRTTLSDTYIVHMKQSDDGYHRDSMEDTEISRQDLHVVMPGSLELIKSRTIDCIFIFLNVTTHISHTDLMTLFDIEYDEMRHQDLVTQSMFIKDQVLETRHNLGEICIPPVNTKDSLIRKFHTSVTTAQERLLWLSSSEIDEQIAVKYPSYLGQYCDLNKLSQRGQSFYQN